MLEKIPNRTLNCALTFFATRLPCEEVSGQRALSNSLPYLSSSSFDLVTLTDFAM